MLSQHSTAGGLNYQTTVLASQMFMLDLVFSWEKNWLPLPNTLFTGIFITYEYDVFILYPKTYDLNLPAIFGGDHSHAE